MDADLHHLDTHIASLEAELQRLKAQRLARLGRPPRALDGVRVFDLSRLIFGPFCTQMLADMGADVIKVEPRTGEQARQAGTAFLNGESASFLARNRGKRSLRLDLRQPAAQEIAHLPQDPRFATRAARFQHGDELTAVVEAILRTKTRQEWLAQLQQYDVLCAPVYNYAEVFTDPQVVHNGMVVEQHHPIAGPIKVVGTPIKLSQTPGQLDRAAPRLGEHTDEILRWLGYNTAQVEHFRQEQVM